MRSRTVAPCVRRTLRHPEHQRCGSPHRTRRRLLSGLPVVPAFGKAAALRDVVHASDAWCGSLSRQFGHEIVESLDRGKPSRRLRPSDRVGRPTARSATRRARRPIGYDVGPLARSVCLLVVIDTHVVELNAVPRVHAGIDAADVLPFLCAHAPFCLPGAFAEEHRVPMGLGAALSERTKGPSIESRDSRACPRSRGPWA